MITIAKFNLGIYNSLTQSPLTMDEYTKMIPSGLYTTFVTIDDRKKVIGLKSHLARLCTSAGNTKLRSLLGNFLSKVDSTGELKIRIINNGLGEFDSIIFLAESFVPIDPKILEEGIRVGLSNVLREAPKIKSSAYITKSYDARIENHSSGIYESLIVKNNKIREGFTSNVYFIREKSLITASKYILSGVTRKVVLDIVRELGILIHYKSFRVAELLTVDEAFITSSSRGVVPIRQIDDYILPGEGRGVVTKLIQERYFETILQVAEEI